MSSHRTIWNADTAAGYTVDSGDKRLTTKFPDEHFLLMGIDGNSDFVGLTDRLTLVHVDREGAESITPTKGGTRVNLQTARSYLAAKTDFNLSRKYWEEGQDQGTHIVHEVPSKKYNSCTPSQYTVTNDGKRIVSLFPDNQHAVLMGTTVSPRLWIAISNEGSYLVTGTDGHHEDWSHSRPDRIGNFTMQEARNGYGRLCNSFYAEPNKDEYWEYGQPGHTHVLRKAKPKPVFEQFRRTISNSAHNAKHALGTLGSSCCPGVSGDHESSEGSQGAAWGGEGWQRSVGRLAFGGGFSLREEGAAGGGEGQ